MKNEPSVIEEPRPKWRGFFSNYSNNLLDIRSLTLRQVAGLAGCVIQKRSPAVSQDSLVALCLTVLIEDTAIATI
jgi:hypothetical protein